MSRIEEIRTQVLSHYYIHQSMCKELLAEIDRLTLENANWTKQIPVEMVEQGLEITRCHKAIDILITRKAALVEALRPFEAEYQEWSFDAPDDVEIWSCTKGGRPTKSSLKLGHLRAAHKALENSK